VRNFQGIRVHAYTTLAGLPAGAAGLTTRFTRLGFVDREGTAFELFAVEPLNGGFGRLALGHLDKSKTFGAAGVTVGNHIDLVHNSILLKELAEVMIRCTKRKVPYKDIHAKVLFIVKNRETIARSSEQYAGVQNARAHAGETAKKA
jgi:hypothetical protein